MLLMKELIESIPTDEQKYIPMLKQVNIPDFTKCIATISNLHIKDIPDEQIQQYLLTWARNKYRFFKMLKGKIRIDIPIEYEQEYDEDELKFKYIDIAKSFPAYAPWLGACSFLSENKIETHSYRAGKLSQYIKEYLPIDISKVNNMTVTHFFKRYLNASEEVVTEIAKIYADTKISAQYTISIDPVDIMLSSENPYNWDSCYRLDPMNTESHADGCLAEVLDTSSLVTYLWSDHGKYTLYDKYLFKDIRYKRVRQTISISPKFYNIHFNIPYPKKAAYSDDFRKMMREPVEKLVAEHLGMENLWVNNTRTKAEEVWSKCDREYYYGYDEYSNGFIFRIKDGEVESWEVFDTPIYCPCGCNFVLRGSNDTDDYGDDVYYSGNGFIHNCIEEVFHSAWCKYCDEYCDAVDECCYEECQDCSEWQRAHPVCALDNEYKCEEFDLSDLDLVEDGVIEPELSGNRCLGCPIYKHCHSKETIQEEKNNRQTHYSSTEPPHNTSALSFMNPLLKDPNELEEAMDAFRRNHAGNYHRRLRYYLTQEQVEIFIASSKDDFFEKIADPSSDLYYYDIPIVNIGKVL